LLAVLKRIEDQALLRSLVEDELTGSHMQLAQNYTDVLVQKQLSFYQSPLFTELKKSV